MINEIPRCDFVGAQITVRLARIFSFSGSLGMEVLTNGAALPVYLPVDRLVQVRNMKSQAGP